VPCGPGRWSSGYFPNTVEFIPHQSKGCRGEGWRVGEALMLTVDDVNFTNHRIAIRRLKNGLGGEKPLWRHTAKFLRSYLRRAP
jgi:hypothetical protein